MYAIRMALVSALGASALALAACEVPADDAATGEDAEMTTTADDSAMTPDDPVVTPPGATSTPPADDDANGDTPDGDRCGAGKVAKYVGDEATPDVRARITADVGHTRIRWIGPDTVVTMDYSPERLNVTMDAGDVITGANCA